MKTAITFDDFPVDQVGTLATIADVLSWYLVDVYPGEDGFLVDDAQIFEAACEVLTACGILHDDDESGRKLEAALLILRPNRVALNGRIRTTWPTTTPPTTD